MEQINFQARWDQTNSHLQSGSFENLKNFLLSPVQSLCRSMIMPATQLSSDQIAQVDRLWLQRWEDPASAATIAADALLLRTHYEPIVLHLTAPDGTEINGTLYRHRRSNTIDIPTLICCQPNGGIARGGAYDWLLKKGCKSPQPFNVISFDYRSCGASRGTLRGLKELQLDAETVYQAAKETLHISERNLHPIGFSMGGAVSASLAANHPLSGRAANIKSFDSLENTIRLSPAVKQIIDRLPLPSFLNSLLSSDLMRSLLAKAASLIGWGFDVRQALDQIKERTLFIYHPEDSLIPETAAAFNAIAVNQRNAAQVVKMQFKPTITCRSSEVDHHNMPLLLYQDENGLNASKKIVNFILGRDLFRQQRAEADRRHYTV